MTNEPAENTDRELWREPTDEVGMEYYQPSIHVTAAGGIGIDVGGTVYVKRLRDWHDLARRSPAPAPVTPLSEVADMLHDVRNHSDDPEFVKDLVSQCIEAVQSALLPSSGPEGVEGKWQPSEAQMRERAAAVALRVGNFGDYRREELTADYGQPRFDMMNDIVEAIRALSLDSDADPYDQGRRDVLNALLALNPRAAQAHHIINGGTETTFTNQEGKLPFDVVFWVTTVADQLGIKPRDELDETSSPTATMEPI